VRANVKPESNVYTDTHSAYEGLEDEYVHEAVNHLEEYMQGAVHTNGLENYWSLFKRAYHGTWIHLSDEHLHRYLSEQNFRFNERIGKDGDQLHTMIGHIPGRRLTYKALTGKP
jgi:transposase-like protein